MMSKDSERTWLITGCDKGMGLAIAEAALKQGDSVAATVLDPQGRSPLTDQYPGKCRAYHLDVTRHDTVQQAIKRAQEDFGHIDILVNNAGYGLLGAAEETTEQEYRRLFEVNFFGLVEVTRAVLPGMRQRRRGRVINFSSMVGFIGFSGMAFYSASKFAVEGYTESLAAEVAHLGIQITMIEPGSFRSDFAGASLVTAKTEIDDYAVSAGVTRKYMQSRHGTQPGDPDKLALALVRLSRLDNPPVRLPLGPDAWQQVLDKVQRVEAEVRKWKEISFSTSFDQ